MHNDILSIIALSKIPLIGPKTAKVLISYSGGPAQVFTQSKKELLKIPGIGQKAVASILSSDTMKIAEAELLFTEKNNIQAISYLDSDYPKRCKFFDDCPLVLYHQGNTKLDHERTVAIVGTRKPTQYGKTSCEKIVEGLAAYNPLIVSGLAYGIDSTAHRKAVELNIPTVGILGHGLDMVYPAANRKLADRMKNNGGLLSEFTSGLGPEREHFPMRNRIIASLSDVVIVIESAKRGGSIITAEIANNYNKDVFAVPGRTNDEFSEGCNRLIKQHKANLIESAEDISYIMRWEHEVTPGSRQTTLLLDLNPKEQAVYDAIKEAGTIHIDLLAHKLSSPLSELSSIMLTMEFNGIIKTLPGKMYTLY